MENFIFCAVPTNNKLLKLVAASYKSYISHSQVNTVNFFVTYLLLS